MVFAAVSNEVPLEPVFNKASGHVYERRLIEKYISEHGKDPCTGAECTVEDLQDVKGTYAWGCGTCAATPSC